MDAAFLDVVNGIKGAIKQSGRAPKPAEAVAPRITPLSTPTGSPLTTPIRSSNLRVTQEFTDQDRDRFLHDAFEYMAKFFERSLQELTARNPGIEGSFRRVDANRFTSLAYRDGKAVARCSIFMGGHAGFAGGICYAHNDSGATNAFNENISVKDDDQMLYLQALGMAHMGGGREDKLTMEGAAEYF